MIQPVEGWKRYAFGILGVLTLTMCAIAWRNVGDPAVPLYSEALSASDTKKVAEALSAKRFWFRFNESGKFIEVHSSQRLALQEYLAQRVDLSLSPGDLADKDAQDSSPEVQELARWSETQPGVKTAVFKILEPTKANPPIKVRAELRFSSGAKLTSALENEIRKRLVQRIPNLKNQEIEINGTTHRTTPKSGKG